MSAKLNMVKLRVSQLRSTLETTEVRYQEKYIQKTFQMRLAYEQVEQVKFESCPREAELKEELKKARADIEEIKANIRDKETKLRSALEIDEDRYQEKYVQSTFQIRLPYNKLGLKTDFKSPFPI